MDRHDDLGARGEGPGQQGFVQVAVVRPDVHEDRGGAAQHKGGGGGRKRERRHDDFVARTDVAQKGGHLQGGGAGMGEQGAAHAEMLFHPGLAAFGEGAVPGKMGLHHGLGDVIQFLAGDEGPIERYFFHGDPRKRWLAAWLETLRTAPVQRQVRAGYGRGWVRAKARRSS